MLEIDWMFVRAARFKSSLEPNVTERAASKFGRAPVPTQKEADAPLCPFGTDLVYSMRKVVDVVG